MAPVKVLTRDPRPFALPEVFDSSSCGLRESISSEPFVGKKVGDQLKCVDPIRFLACSARNLEAWRAREVPLFNTSTQKLGKLVIAGSGYELVQMLTIPFTSTRFANHISSVSPRLLFGEFDRVFNHHYNLSQSLASRTSALRFKFMAVF